MGEKVKFPSDQEFFFREHVKLTCNQVKYSDEQLKLPNELVKSSGEQLHVSLKCEEIRVFMGHSSCHVCY